MPLKRLYATIVKTQTNGQLSSYSVGIDIQRNRIFLLYHECFQKG